MNLDVQIGNLRKPLMFVAVYDLAVQLILGISYQGISLSSFIARSADLSRIFYLSVAILDKFDSLMCTLDSSEDT